MGNQASALVEEYHGIRLHVQQLLAANYANQQYTNDLEERLRATTDRLNEANGTVEMYSRQVDTLHGQLAFMQHELQEAFYPPPIINANQYRPQYHYQDYDTEEDDEDQYGDELYEYGDEAVEIKQEVVEADFDEEEEPQYAPATPATPTPEAEVEAPPPPPPSPSPLPPQLLRSPSPQPGQKRYFEQDVESDSEDDRLVKKVRVGGFGGI